MIPEGAGGEEPPLGSALVLAKSAGREDGSTRVAMPAMPAGAVGCSA